MFKGGCLRDKIISGKFKSARNVVDSIPTREDPPTYFLVSEEVASTIRVGDKVSTMLSGTVKSMRNVSMTDDRKRMFEIGLADPQISSVAMNAADFEMKRMER